MENMDKSNWVTVSIHYFNPVRGSLLIRKYNDDMSERNYGRLEEYVFSEFRLRSVNDKGKRRWEGMNPMNDSTDGLICIIGSIDSSFPVTDTFYPVERSNVLTNLLKSTWDKYATDY